MAEILIKILAASTCKIDFFSRSIAASNFCDDRKSTLIQGRMIVNEHFSALSLLLCLNLPGDIFITINNSAMVIIFNALWKSLA